MKRTFCKIIALSLAVVLCFSNANFVVFADDTVEATTATEYLTEVPDGYIGIYTKEDLDNIRNDLTANYILMNDINFAEEDFAEKGAFFNDGKGWIPIGSSEFEFSGVLDGNNHKIINLQISMSSTDAVNAGLFGCNSGTIKNLTLSDGHITAFASGGKAKVNAGSIVSCNYGSILNCHNSTSVSAYMTDPESSSGWIGVRAGGIAGVSMSASVLSDCTNTGDIVISSEKGEFVETNAGGIVGESSGLVSDCKNYADIKILNISYSEYSGAGGIVGYLCTEGTVIYSENVGNVFNYDNGNNASSGGIAGENDGNISNSNNTGSISTEGKVTATAGGITGSARWNSGLEERKITCSYNTGNIYASSGSDLCSAIAAGIAAGGGDEISSCWNAGEISAISENAICSGISLSGYILNCYNIGNVVTEGNWQHAGGIVAISGTVDCSYNIGNIIAKGNSEITVGGISSYQGEGDISSSYFLNTTVDGIGTWEDLEYTGNLPTICSFNEMLNQKTYEGFDFDSTWIISDCGGFLLPQLINNPMVDFNCEMVCIEMSDLPSVVIYHEERDSLDVTGGAIRLCYNNGNVVNKKLSDEMVSGFDNTITGTQKITVTYDGATTTFNITVEGHTAVTDKAVAATCTTTGKTAGSHCSVCNTVLKAQKTVAATGHHYGSWKTVTAATCTTIGKKQRTCTACGKIESKSIAKLGHNYSSTWTIDKRATMTANGSKSHHCIRCDAKKDKTTIYKAKTVKLSAVKFVYNGKVRTPSVVIKNSNGNTIAPSNYTVKKATGRKNVGKYTYKITFKNQYKGTKSLIFTINPKATTIKKPTAAKKALTAKWTKVSKQATGYEIMVATNKNFTKNKKTVKATSYKTTSKKITGLKSKKTYYVKVRTYKMVNGVPYYSSWSKYRTVKTK